MDRNTNQSNNTLDKNGNITMCTNRNDIIYINNVTNRNSNDRMYTSIKVVEWI